MSSTLHAVSFDCHDAKELAAFWSAVLGRLVTGDLPGEVKRLVDLGAVRQQEVEEGGYHWLTLTDPDGNEFDVIAT